MFNRVTFRPHGVFFKHAIQQNELILFYYVLEEDPMGSKRHTIKHDFTEGG